MNRRGFFQTLLAATAAIFLPKSEKGEYVVDFDTSTAANDSMSVQVYAMDRDNNWFLVDTFPCQCVDGIYSYTCIYPPNDRYSAFECKITENQNG